MLSVDYTLFSLPEHFSVIYFCHIFKCYLQQFAGILKVISHFYNKFISVITLEKRPFNVNVYRSVSEIFLAKSSFKSGLMRIKGNGYSQLAD
jgi:hypothetical protein